MGLTEKRALVRGPVARATGTGSRVAPARRGIRAARRELAGNGTGTGAVLT